MASSVWPWRARLAGAVDAPDGAVHDGDTITMVIDCGFEDLKLLHVRLLGTYAPELKDVGGTETRDYTSQWLLGHLTAVRWPFWLDTTRTTGDADNMTLGRYLGTVWTADRKACLNTDTSAWITAQGYGPGRGKP